MRFTSLIPRSGKTYSGALVAALLFAPWSGGAAAAGAPISGAAAEAGLHEAVLEVAVSRGGPGHMMIVLRGPGGALLLEAQDFQRLRLRVPSTRPVLRDGRRYYSPAAIPGSSVSIDEARQRAVISVPSAALDTTRLSAPVGVSPTITPASPGAFFNYQLYSQHVTGQTSGGVYGELGVFAGAGVLTNSEAGRTAAGRGSLVRLDTTYTVDFPQRLETLNVGDAISDSGTWGYAVRYAGIRWSRNFALRPDLLTTPLLTTGGTATVPSTVDVFVNNQLVTSSQLPAGPFVIDRLPTVSGSGDVSVVVRDALGREQVLTQSFYSSPSLLAPGLSQYSFNLGSVREDYALASSRYGTMLAEGSYRRGIRRNFTLEGHAEYQRGGAHAAGFDAAIGIGDLGLVTLQAAGGGDASGSGWLRGAGFERNGSRLSLLVSDAWYGRQFAQVGEPQDPALRLRERRLGQVGLAMGRFGSLSLAYVRQSYRGTQAEQTLSLTHSRSLGRNGSLNLTVTRLLGAQPSTSVYLFYVLPFGHRRAATATVVGGRGTGAPANEAIATMTQSPPVGPGMGYRVSASSAGNYDADWRRQYAAADVELETARNSGVTGTSAYVSGSLTFLDHRLNATRQIDGSFAMVDLGGLGNVPIYVENQLTTHTDSSGKAILYNLRPYEANRISVDPADLPLDTTIGSASAIVAPPYRSGIVVRFPIERTRGATMHLVTPDGKPVPVGAIVDFKGSAFPVVLDGLVYVTGYDHGLGATANWPGGACRFRVPPPQDDDPLPDLGTIRCRPYAPGRGPR